MPRRHLRRALEATIAAALMATAVGLTLPGIAPGQKSPHDAAVEVELGQRLAARLRAWHEGAEPNDRVLKLVYFHPADAPPQNDHRARLTRMMSDIRDFLRDEMHGRYGFDGTLPLEIGDDQLLHYPLVEGAQRGLAYQYPDGRKLRTEIADALPDVIDFANDHVLVIGGLCRKRDDGSYFFHSPYYGDGSSNHLRGLCYAADGEMLDTRHLTREALDEIFSYEEHQGPFTKTLADFNALYIGGLAHELGHGLSLPHNGERWAQRPDLGTALMGNGNFTYRRERFTDQPGSFLTLASALRLATLPLFTGSDRGRDRDPAPTTRLADASFVAEGLDLVIAGRIVFDPEMPPLAVIAYKDPEGGSDYDAKTAVAEVDPASGRFEVRAINHKPGRHQLRLTLVFPNGATLTPLRQPYDGNADGAPDADRLSTDWLIEPIERLWLDDRHDEAREIAERHLAAHPDNASLRLQLNHLLGSTVGADDNPAFLDLSADTFTGDSAALSDAAWSVAEVGWGEPVRDYYFHGPPPYRDAVLLRPGGDFHAKGLYAHAPAKYEYELGGSWRRFTSLAGLQGGVPGGGQARFIVLGDGRELFRSDILKSGATATIDIDIRGVETLTLVTESGMPGNGGCWSVWGSPRVAR